jgi:hypothetical protein
MNKDRIRRFTFNIHHWKDNGIDKDTVIHLFTQAYAIDYMIIGEELTTENEVPHLQGYIEFANPATWEQVRERFIAIVGYVSDLQASKGDAKSNQLYCSKAGQFTEYGSFTEKVKVDDQAVNVVKLLHEGQRLMAILVNNPAYSQYIVKNFTQLQKVESALITERNLELEAEALFDNNNI